MFGDRDAMDAGTVGKDHIASAQSFCQCAINAGALSMDPAQLGSLGEYIINRDAPSKKNGACAGDGFAPIFGCHSNKS
jgi:hypothetical protein